MQKKKKTPVLAISIISVAFLVFILFNSVRNPAELFSKKPEPNMEPTAASPEAQAQTKNALAAAAGTRDSGEQPSPEQRGAGANPDEPSILIKETQIVKPVVNDSAVSGMWYKDDSRQKAETERLERERKAAGQ